MRHGLAPLYFAPMEGVTDVPYRLTLAKLYSDWDYYSTDFYRIPSVGVPSESALIKHMGEEIYSKKELRDKTAFQVLASENSQIEEFFAVFNALKIEWLDLNLGCPSKNVTKHLGGSYLLSNLDLLKKILYQIRNKYEGFLSCKIRVGFHDDSKFEEILRLIQECRVDSLTIHARTQKELYKGIANWDYHIHAAQILKIPLIVNGDIWNRDDAITIQKICPCQGIMLARGAMKTPWFSQIYYGGQNQDEQTLRYQIFKFLNTYFDIMQNYIHDDQYKLKRMKAVSRYLFDDLKAGPEIKRKFLRSASLSDCFSVLEQMLLEGSYEKYDSKFHQFAI